MLEWQRQEYSLRGFNGFSFSDFKRISQISICCRESCLLQFTPLGSSPLWTKLEEPGSGQQLRWEFQQSFTKLSPFRCLFFSSAFSGRRIRKPNEEELEVPWRCPQGRESCQEGIRSKAWRNELQICMNPVCTGLWPDPELALPKGVKGTHLESLGRHQISPC